MRWIVLIALLAAVIAGCGSGGGNSVDPTPAPAPAPGAATLRLSTEGTSSAMVIYAVEMAISLPAGVTLSVDPATGEVTSGVLYPTDGGALAGAKYIPATASSRATVRLNIADPGGFPVGSLATLSCSVLPAPPLDVSAFSVDGFSARDANGALVAGITPLLTVQTQ